MSDVPIPIGLSLRNMGVQSTPSILGSAARAADAAGFESLFITDHIAIPPDDAEGSGGRYLDPLATLAWLAGQTSRIRLGTGVLILPYRPALPTAKLVATVQELSSNRLLLGVGIGWMRAEFKAVGVDLRRRASVSDATLRFLHECFDNRVVTANGQEMIFSPRPPRPPILIGGAAPHAVNRALALGDGWMPMGRLDKLRPTILDYVERARAAGKPDPEVVTFGALDPRQPDIMRRKIDEYAAAGVTRLVTSTRYEEAGDLQQYIDLMAETLWN